ncbi:M15 family metallopeptidase [Galbibacter sp.]|uniref:M15 family metallopeptidase n=1 Tax=Galbibacter sp. TaxID=2918471 RepID=UPI002CB01372|nr:M15 family metallopeptidase [Galbibacter sp.]HLV61941.1 M15 family metallopeptidase [Galbibacter sp.]
MKLFLVLSIVGLFMSCKEPSQKKSIQQLNLATVDTVAAVDTVAKLPEVVKKQVPDLSTLADTTFVRLADYSDDFVYDMRYATENNFLKAQVYQCGECYVRAITAKALIKANKAFMEQGYRIKFFDCYRPHDVQKKMWEIVPNATYVANPAKGSIHNKGGAVDITLTTLEGEQLDMGTTFDFFGRKARHAYQELPKQVLDNRKLLKSGMEAYGFGAITSEWWHYNYRPTLGYPIANFRWDCE